MGSAICGQYENIDNEQLFNNDDFTYDKQLIPNISKVLYEYMDMNSEFKENNDVIKSIYYVILSAYYLHSDIMMTKDAILSQFFLLFSSCDECNVFSKNKTVVIDITVKDTLNSEELRTLPMNFVNREDLLDTGIDDVDNVINVLKTCDVSTNIAYMSALKHRISYHLYTRCKVPNFSINCTKEEMTNVIKLMKSFMNMRINSESDMLENGLENYNILLKYVVLIEKIYDMCYNKRVDRRFFKKLIEQSDICGRLDGYVSAFKEAKDHGTVNIERVIGDTKYLDLEYTHFLICVPYKNNKLLWTTAYSYPKIDTCRIKNGVILKKIHSHNIKICKYVKM